MKYQIQKHSGLSAYLQLYRQLREDIVSGLLPTGTKLPSKRSFANDPRRRGVAHADDIMYLNGEFLNKPTEFPNEAAVAAFLGGRIRFTDIPHIITDTVEKCQFIEKPDFDAIYSTNFEAQRIAAEIIGNKYAK